MVKILPLIELENQRWQSCTVEPDKRQAFLAVARHLASPPNKLTYQQVEADTKVPWFVVAVIHEREAGANFSRSIAQGDPFNRVSTHVPKGRGPFPSFLAAAHDALVNCAPRAASWTDWSAGGMLTLLEQYNGLGYANRGLPSPYIWAGTDQYTRGKYVADGRFDATVVDGQLGCAGLLRAMMELDPTIKLGAYVPAGSNAPVAKISPSRPAVPVVPAPTQTPLQPGPASRGAGFLASLLATTVKAMFSHRA